MRKLMQIVPVIAALTFGACASSAPGDDLTDSDFASVNQGGKSDSATDVAWKSTVPNIVPKRVYEFFQTYQWGDFHIFFHLSARWYVSGSAAQKWLKSKGVTAATLQEGDVGEGVEFLAMHRAMINSLTQAWGNEPVANNEDGFTTFAQVLGGWNTDAKVIAHLKKVGGDYQTFQAAVKELNKFSNFASEEEFATFLQTTLRRVSTTSTTAKPKYTHSTDPNSGLHNWLHDQFSDSSSPIDVGNPQVNLSNMRFWGIHGWVEAKWEAFEKVHVRTAAETATYNANMNTFNAHMASHSGGHIHDVPQLKTSTAQKLAPMMFPQTVACANVTPDAEVDYCD